MDAVVLTRLLSSKNEARARAAVTYLVENEDHDHAVQMLTGILDEQESKIAACGEWKSEGWEWLILLDFVGLALGPLFGLAVGVQHLRHRRRQLSHLRRNAALALAGLGEAHEMVIDLVVGAPEPVVRDVVE